MRLTQLRTVPRWLPPRRTTDNAGHDMYFVRLKLPMRSIRPSSTNTISYSFHYNMLTTAEQSRAHTGSMRQMREVDRQAAGSTPVARCLHIRRDRVPRHQSPPASDPRRLPAGSACDGLGIRFGVQHRRDPRHTGAAQPLREDPPLTAGAVTGLTS
jgi:hypothetical protein